MSTDERAERALRADARRNEQRLLEAARDSFIRFGADVPLEVIARAAGTGVGTLYRRFPNRRALATAVVREALLATGIAAASAITESDPREGLRSYVHAVVALRTSAVIPQLLEIADPEDAERQRLSAEILEAVDGILRRGHDAGSVRPGITSADISLLLVRLSQPITGLPPAVQTDYARRHTDIVLAGLFTDASDEPLGGPQLSLEELRRLS